ncbi:hypothetical protein MESS2_1460014 [Mesorhizobium metallidurans STM 2683]|uniref:Uncharacterized protein n=1 Tax=Mesorhizobium metallidurans STM 2683 TaxID=1297569 RepID=M5EJN4_9HYPH|nr:hypothetical protein MESS2_1460014 [Mesorhizobium metallidurans STM 2683]
MLSFLVLFLYKSVVASEPFGARVTCPPRFGGITPIERGRYHGPVITQYRFRRRRPQPLPGRNPTLSHASATGRVHARQALRRA